MIRARGWVLGVAAGAALFAQAHRAEQDREIRYWLLAPESHRFRISHDFTVGLEGQKSVHSFVRAGSEVAPDSKMFDLDTGEPLHTHLVNGAEVNALGYYPTPTDPKSVVVQGDLPAAVGKDESVRIRVEETYTDPVGYKMSGAELVWTRTLGRPVNDVTLPDGWMLTASNVPARVRLDSEGRITLRTVFGKFFCTSATLASGIPLGREGPSVQVGAGIGSVLGRSLGLKTEQVQRLIPVGAAAAIAAAFNTPLAAVLFALEEITGDLYAPVMGAVVLASATSWMVLHVFLGDQPRQDFRGKKVRGDTQVRLHALQHADHRLRI